MLNLLVLRDDFWRSFADYWTVCDDTWDHQEELLVALYDAGPGWEEEIGPECLAWFEALPQTLRIYRGCSRERVHGLSWTTDKKTAIGFARGHRGDPRPRSRRGHRPNTQARRSLRQQ